MLPKSRGVRGRDGAFRQRLQPATPATTVLRFNVKHSGTGCFVPDLALNLNQLSMEGREPCATILWLVFQTGSQSRASNWSFTDSPPAAWAWHLRVRRC